ncbi:MAG: methionine--tRNA ligase [Polyangiales bacterium]
MSGRFYVTTPIYYVNASPHVGTAYTTVVADALARYHRLRGDETFFLTGTDEHGLKLQTEAEKQGMTPQAFVDSMSERFRALLPKLLLTPDDFIRTTQARHEARVQHWWARCREAGDIYLGAWEGLYCVACEEMYTEKELLPGGLCPVHERPVGRVQEESYFFRMSRYADRLLAYYKRRPEAVRPETRLNEVVSFIEGGLRDLSISRTSFTWGIPVPGDPKHVMYVWFDALFNYLTAVEDQGRAGRFWPPDVQLVGKDILRFHAVYWPAFLMSAGFEDDALPRTVWGHGWLVTGGKKVSKTRAGGGVSRGTTDAVRLADALGADALRYFLLREVSFGQDGEWSVPALVGRVRAELTETVGNLLNRALPFLAKHFDGLVPVPGEPTDVDRALEAAAESAARGAAEAWGEPAPHRALEHTIELARAGNKYFDESAPWKLAKSGDLARLATVIYHVLEVVRQVSLALWPATPSKSDALRAQLGLEPMAGHVGADLWPHTWGGLASGTKVAPGSPVFPRYDAQQEAQIFAALDVSADDGAEEKAPPAKAEPPPAKKAEKAPEKPVNDAPPPPPITYDELMAKVDLRVGRVKTAERIPRKDRLLKLTVDLGEPTGPRTIIAGIATAYAPEALVERQVVVVANLPPRDFGGGLVSHGMLLAASTADGLTLATFEKDAAPGTRVK